VKLNPKRMRLRWCSPAVGVWTLLALFALVSEPCVAQALYPRPALVETGGIVRAIAVQPDGKIVVGGTFTSLNGTLRKNIGRLNADGTLDASWDPGANGEVYSLAISGAVIYVGGTFTAAGGQPRQNVAALDTTTGLATSWTPPINTGVAAIAIAGRTVYLGGGIFSSGNRTRVGIAAVDAVTGSLTSWNASANAGVSAIAILGNMMYVGGGFTSIGGQARSRIAALDLATGTAASWNPGAADDWIDTALIAGNVIYVAGRFTTLGTVARNYLAAIDLSSGQVTDWNPDPDDPVNALAVAGNQVYATGGFYHIGGQTRLHLAALDAATGDATSFVVPLTYTGAALAATNNVLYVGGAFDQAAGQSHFGIVALDALSGTPLAGLRSAGWFEVDLHTEVSATAIDNQGRLVIGGAFELVEGHPRMSLARYNADGSLDLTWAPSVDGTVSAIAVSSNVVYVAGKFDAINGIGRSNLAAIDATTGAVMAWNPAPHGPLGVITLTGNTLYVAGDFVNMGGLTVPSLAAIDALSGETLDWYPPEIFGSGPVYAIVVSDQAVYVGGDFTGIGNFSRGHLVALDPATAQPLPWNPDADNVVHSIALLGNTIYAGGEFTHIGNVAVPYLAAIDAMTGQPVTGWNPNPNSSVYHVVAGGGAVYVGGFFSTIGGKPRNIVAALDPTTGAATSWNPHPLFEPDVDVVSTSVLADRVILGGRFLSMAGQTRAHIASVAPSNFGTRSATTLTSSLNPSLVGQTVSFSAIVTGKSPTGSVTFFDGATALPGCAGVALSGGGSPVAICTLATMGLGAHGVVAVYNGDVNNVASTSATITESIVAPGEINVALSANGGAATASSTYLPSTYPVAAIINNERAGLNWGNGGGWNDNTSNVYPDWVQIDFNGSKAINRVVVYTLQDNYTNPIEPTDTMTFSQYGLTDFNVQGWNGSAWVTLGTVSGNNLVKRTVNFASYTTSKIRVNVTAALTSYSRITEVEAWGQAVAGPSPSTTTLNSSANPSVVGSLVTLTATVMGTAPTGAVTFADGGTPIANCAAVALAGSGNIMMASCATSALAAGTHSIVASYSGDSGNAPSSNAALSQVVNAIGGTTNVALASNGGVASASSAFSVQYSVNAINNNERAGLNWGNGGGWNDNTANNYPDWVQIVFNSTKTIDHVVVYTVQDNYANPVEPTDAQTFSLYGITSFNVQGKQGKKWVTLGTVTGNNLVKRTVTFASFATDRIRININGALASYSRITEVEAWGH